MAYDALCQSHPQFCRGASHYSSHTSLSDLEDGRKDETSLTKVFLDSESTCKKDLIKAPNKILKASRQLSRSDPDLSLSGKVKVELGEKQSSRSDIVSAEYELKRQTSMRQAPVHLKVGDKPEIFRRTSTGSHYDGSYLRFEFEVSDVFMFGSPLGLVLAYRRLYSGDGKNFPPLRPACHQVYNLFHSSDPTAIRIEPLIKKNFQHIPPKKIPRYSKYPLGDGESLHVVEAIQSNLYLFSDCNRGSMSPKGLRRQGSMTSMTSQVSGLGETSVSTMTQVVCQWWGSKRLDYVLYCPEVLQSFPTNALPHLFHASFWESMDVVAFILRQILRQEFSEDVPDKTEGEKGTFSVETHPPKKWLKRRTTIKVKNLQSNHRANDVLVLEDKIQILTARFMYGPLDMTSLSGEKVDVHVLEQPSGDWSYIGTAVTDNHGRVAFPVPEEKMLHQGMYPIKMVVRGDHSTADFFLGVLPPKTEMVVFSIDGSFTASVSIMGKDPKVRAGAVDIVRHWQELGYLILYVTARPDMQHNKVVGWLAQHNFPHGMVAFMDGFSKEPLRQKLNLLRGYQTEAGVTFRAAYGSSKDIYVYKELGMKSNEMYIVGKASKKQAAQAQIIESGYAAHLQYLMSPGVTRPAVGNAKMFIRKYCFSLPSQPIGKNTKHAAKRTISGAAGAAACEQPGSQLTDVTVTIGEAGNTLLTPCLIGCPTVARARGTSPRPKIPFRTDQAPT